MKATQLLHNLGQSIWLDNITRDLLNSGTLQHYIGELSVTSLASRITNASSSNVSSSSGVRAPAVIAGTLGTGRGHANTRLLVFAAPGLTCQCHAPNDREGSAMSMIVRIEHPVEDFDRWHQERGGFRMDWSEPHNNEYTLQGDVYGGIFPHQVGTTTFVDNVSGGNILGRWTSKFSDGSDIYLQAYFDRTVRAGGDITETRNTFDVDFEHHLKLGTRNDFIYGGGIRFSPNHIVQEQVAENVITNIETDYIYSAFLQDQMRFFRDRVLITVGSKFLDNNFSGFDVEPTGRLLWNPNPQQSFWTAVTRAVTTPSRLEEGLQLTGEVSANPPACADSARVRRK